jgi:hypothetical protein
VAQVDQAAQPAQAGGSPNTIIAPPQTAGAVRTPSSASQYTGTPGQGAYSSPVQTTFAAEDGGAVTSPNLGGATAMAGSAGQVSLSSGPPGTQNPHNPVEAYREGERIRRAYVEERRVMRIGTIVQARQQGGDN